MTLLVVIVRYCDAGPHWVAWYDGNPCFSYTGEFSTEAARRLLEATRELDADVTLRIEQADGTELTVPALWRVPELFLRKTCPQCGGKGVYVGLTTKELCETCRGSGIEFLPTA